MYILIFEDGTIAKTDILCEDLLSNAADGYVDVIHVDAQTAKIYTPKRIQRLRDSWSEIKVDEIYI
jgi:hypothetical protein